MKISTIIFSGVIFCSALCIPVPLFAASVSFVTPHTKLQNQEEFVVDVVLDSGSVPINAVDMKIRFPQDSLVLKEIRDTNSFINFWIDKPALIAPGELMFSGITPGGFYGKKAQLLSLVFRAIKSGAGTLQVESVRTLKNDGNGTELVLAHPPLKLAISSVATSTQILALHDTTRPEEFSPVLGRDPSLFEGKYFVAFAAKDKGVGIDHFELKEGMWGNFETVESPYILHDQTLTKKIYVKAVDKAGMERISMLVLPRHLLFEIGLILVIILVIVTAGFFFKKILWQKFIH